MTLGVMNDLAGLPRTGIVDEALADISSRRPGSQRASREETRGIVAAHVERRLAAILMADMAGYSRLVGADEHGTLIQWRAHWDELIAPAIQSHSGRVVRVNGDGILAEFGSIVNATCCAFALQRGMAQRNAEISCEKRMQFRIGLNVGDVIVDRGDMWGEGVNVAARLESLAEPGGICVTERVRDDVRGKLDVAFDEVGEQKLKNISGRVRVFRARLDANDDARAEAGAEIARATGGGMQQARSARRMLRYGHFRSASVHASQSARDGWRRLIELRHRRTERRLQARFRANRRRGERKRRRFPLPSCLSSM
jgi:class 3 adenylate cyclase